MNGETQGSRIRVLFENAHNEVTVIAPFIKFNAMQSLLNVIPKHLHLRCVTRWLTREVAAGVSDPEILDLLDERGHFTLTLVDQLHAKLYVADNRCLAGSANVTLAGLGDVGYGSNIEVLVGTTIQDPGVIATLEAIHQTERPATKSMAERVRRLADSLTSREIEAIGLETPWFPCSRHPERAFRYYVKPPSGFIVSADRILLADIANLNFPPDLKEGSFREAVRSSLASIPIAADLLTERFDTTLTKADARHWLDTVAGDEFTNGDLWLAFVNWMGYFFSDQLMKQEICETALRRATLLKKY